VAREFRGQEIPLDKLAEHLDALDVWVRQGRANRKPRFTRDDIAAAAIRIADADGFEAVSMRRIAAELDTGTMTLYHYVRTKDELLTLIVDAVLGEVFVPDTEPFPSEWKKAMALIARRTRDALRRHPWILDIADDPNIGPNAMRHFDQALRAASGLDAPFETRLDLILAVDEYVFGYCLHERNNMSDTQVDADAMVSYIGSLLDRDRYPALSQMVDAHGLHGLWNKIHSHVGDDRRFDRNLARLLAGFESTVRKAKRG
jgi:AcrR family transcriptional regulator